MIWSENALKGKRILITGASSGIGRACAILCSMLGAEIVACGRNEERLADTISKLSGSGHLSLAFDLNNEQNIEEEIRKLKGSNPISGFIHSAGIERTNPLKTVYMDDFVEMFKTNVASATAITKQITKPGIYDKNGLSIVLISSVIGLLGERGKIEYSATKAALSGLTKSLALELSAKNVRVNSISPAMIKTEMLDRMFEVLPRESVANIEGRHLLGIPDVQSVASMAVYLLSDAARYITGTNIVLDSGYSMS
ncbi:MAG: SDR family oxidoreductase [Candidatus Cloacimonetes bacterium]|nr:SDR family oxidoreductase [Candidatus Cloacimonadota bacterium]